MAPIFIFTFFITLVAVGLAPCVVFLALCATRPESGRQRFRRVSIYLVLTIPLSIIALFLELRALFALYIDYFFRWPVLMGLTPGLENEKAP